MKKRILVSTIASALAIASCSDSGNTLSVSDELKNNTLSAAPVNSVSGTVPGTVIEAYGDNGSYYRVESIHPAEGEVDNGLHPFTLPLEPGIGYRLVMITNEGTLNEVITPISFYSDGSATSTQNRFKIADGDKLYLGNVALELDRSKITDANNDGIVDVFILDDDNNPLKQSDVDADGVNDFDDDDHGSYQYAISKQDSQDPDGDGLINVYDDDDDNDGISDDQDDDDDNDGEKDVDEIDSDHDGVPDSVDVNNNNDAFATNKYDVSEDEDGDGYHNLIDTDDDGNGVLDIDEDDDGDGISNARDHDDDGDGVLDIDEDDDGDGVRNADDNDSDGDGMANRFEDDDSDNQANAVDMDDDGDGTLDIDEDDDDDNIKNSDDTDDDNDGISDLDEDDDADGVINSLDIDDDDDGTLDINEDEGSDGKMGSEDGERDS